MDVAESVKIINHTLKHYSFGDKPVELYQPMRYALNLDKERISALLAQWGGYLFSGETEKALFPSLGVEVFYNFLLLHQDLLNQHSDHTRQPRVQDKWNRNVALLSGDVMIFKAYELLIQVDSSLIKPVIRLFNQCFAKVCEGKQLSLNKVESTDEDTPDLAILRLNPGALTRFSLQLGALIGGANSQQLDEIGDIGNNLGILWHLRDQRSIVPGPTEMVRMQLAQLDCDKQRTAGFLIYIEQRFIN